MPVISQKKLKELALAGKVEFGAPPEIKTKPPEQPQKDRKTELLETLITAVKNIPAPADPAAPIDLGGIESLLKQLIELSKPSPTPQKKSNYEFNIVRDMDGRITKVEAKAI